MSDYLFEIYGEEMPSRFQEMAEKQIAQLFHDRLLAHHLTYTQIETYVTPRRLVAHITGLPDKQPDYSEERRGPRVDAPQAAIDGFARSVERSLNTLERRTIEKGEFYFASLTHPGRPLQELLVTLVPEILEAFAWPKSMRWGTSTQAWVRPVHHGLSLLNGSVVPLTWDIGGGMSIHFGHATRGHYLIDNTPLQVIDCEDYKKQLLKNNVMLSFNDRKQAIRDQVKALATQQGLLGDNDAQLLTEVAGLVEWPVTYMGKIDPDFMHLPTELLVTVMKRHQRYFPMYDGAGVLAPYFAVVSNGPAVQNGQNIVEGNERVLRARFNDARFFYENDSSVSLEDHGQKLTQIVFHAQLGSMADKVARLEKLTGHIATHVEQPREDAVHAARLSKCDLTTEMVIEFPELQGVMGRYYATGVSPETAVAIGEHYRPVSAKDDIPHTPLGRIVALADRLDTLVGFFGVGIQPTGSKDPFALRRAALGALRILEEGQLNIPLGTLLAWAIEGYAGSLTVPHGDVSTQLIAFCTERLSVFWKDSGLRYDVIRAVQRFLFIEPLATVRANATAIQLFCLSSDGENLSQGFTRAYSILSKEQAKDGVTYTQEVDQVLLQERAEKSLDAALNALQVDERDMKGSLESLASLRHSIDGFFNTVVVNATDHRVRQNRLRLLNKAITMMQKVANFEEIQVS
ncbi:MAG: glycine--tRNA ligase subunit beta [Alphaproteobacteria bacterium]|nr:MAG: glycine--tRNA ligase subunit beta [Alphaproteobacteria bacterium]